MKPQLEDTGLGFQLCICNLTSATACCSCSARQKQDSLYKKQKALLTLGNQHLPALRLVLTGLDATSNPQAPNVLLRGLFELVALQGQLNNELAGLLDSSTANDQAAQPMAALRQQLLEVRSSIMALKITWEDIRATADGVARTYGIAADGTLL